MKSFITCTHHKIIVRVMKLKRMKWIGHSTHGRHGKLYKILIGKLEWKRPLGRPTCRWEDNMRMNLRDMCWEGVDRNQRQAS
jgi:hypothetical protein